MKCITTYFRAINDYRKNTDKQADCVKARKTVAEADRENDFIETERVKCTIDTDWVEAIEKGLVYVEKALKEERQFIRSNGEVVPIEKVKHVSKSSVEHLARHSELITRFDEDGDITPDKIYTVERLSDYSVYENRFLYMMLCYLRDFISLRYSLILEAVNTYKGKSRVKKTISSPKGEFDFTMELNELARDDEYLSTHNEAKAVLDRIDLIYKTVTVFLSYPLMQEVKKSPMLKPPITKTNVLKMNFNFKNSLALYEYISAYNGNGYTLTTVTNTIKGFKNAAADDFAELVKQASFLTYEYGLDIREYLKGEYEKEEIKRKEEKQKKLVEQIENLRRRVAETGMGMEEYMLLLEKRNRALQEDSDKLAVEKKKNEQLTAELEVKNEKIAELERTVEDLNEKIKEQEARHAAEITALNEAFAAEKAAMEAAHAEEIETLKAQHSEIITNMLAVHKEELANMRDSYESAIRDLSARHDEEVENMRRSHADEMQKTTDGYEQKLAETAAGYEKRIDGITTENRIAAEKAEAARLALEAEKSRLAIENREKQERSDALASETLVLKAKINSLKSQYGAFDGTENFLDENNFDDIEKQYAEFRKFFKETWRKAKKAIRQESKDKLKRQFLAEQTEKSAETTETKPDPQEESERNDNDETND